MGQLTTSSVRVTSCDDGWVSTVDARSWRELFPIEWWLGFRRKMATNTRSLTLSVSAQYRIKLAKPWELSPTPWKKNHQAVRHYLGVKWRQPYCFHYIYYILGLLTNSTLYMTSYSTVCNSLIFFMPLVSHVNLFNTENTPITHIIFKHLLLWRNMFRYSTYIFESPTGH